MPQPLVWSLCFPAKPPHVNVHITTKSDARLAQHRWQRVVDFVFIIFMIIVVSCPACCGAPKNGKFGRALFGASTLAWEQQCVFSWGVYYVHLF